MGTEGLKCAQCISECQVEFLGLRWEMKGLSVEMMAITASFILKEDLLYFGDT